MAMRRFHVYLNRTDRKSSVPAGAALRYGGFSLLSHRLLYPFPNIHIGVDPTSGARVVPASKEWMGDFANEDLGCTGPSEDTYIWREVGYGSNINCESEHVGAHTTDHSFLRSSVGFTLLVKR